jgi:hypothetical protein
MNQRDRVAQLAKTDFAAAFNLTGSIENVRERIQSLGWVARYAPADQVPRVIDAANKCAGTSSDFYEDVMSLAWPLRALHETGNSKLMPSLLQTATKMVADVSPVSSRAEAIGLLIHAALPAGLALADPAISALTTLRNESHWRVVRTFVDVSLLVNAHDRQRSLEIANSIAIENKRKSTIERIQNDEQMEPRPFFW